MKDRDAKLLTKIMQYADEIKETIVRFNLDLGKFKDDYVVKNAIAMDVLQIGELVGSLTEDFKSEHKKMPWRDIVTIRNRAAHAYGSMDIEFLWKTAVNRIPELYAYCKTILEEESG